MQAPQWLRDELHDFTHMDQRDAGNFLRGMVCSAVILLVLMLLVTFAHFKLYGG